MGIGSKFGITAETGNNIVTDGLVFYINPAYKKSYTLGSSDVFNLASGSLTPTGSLFNDVSGSLGSPKAWEFDGVDDYIQFSQNTAGQFSQDPMSFDCWVNLDDVGSTFPIIVMDRALWNGADGIEIYAQNNPPNLYVRGGGTTVLTSTSTFTLGQWYHFVFTYNSTTAQIYINGQLDKSGTVGAVTGNSTYNMYLGRYGDSPLYEWDGKMASIKIYHKVLSATEILQNYNAGKDRFGL